MDGNTEQTKPPSRRGSPNIGYLWALLACVATTIIATPLRAYLDLANIVMLFLLTVLLVAGYIGRGPAVLAAFLGVALFDFFFVPPRFSFTVNDEQYLVTFAVMLAVAIVTGHLTAGLRQQAEKALLRERRARTLYEISRGLAGALTLGRATEVVAPRLRDAFDLEVALLPADMDGKLTLPAQLEHPPRIEALFAHMAFDHGEPVTDYEVSGYGYGAGYFPLTSSGKLHGVIVFIPRSKDSDPLHEERPLLGTVAAVVAIAVERLRLTGTTPNPATETGKPLMDAAQPE